MNFAWNKELEIGIEALDSQHKQIFDSINAYFQLCADGGGIDEAKELFDYLDNYTKMHFIYEEKLQKYSRYPGLELQQKQHALFIAELAELRKGLYAPTPSKDVIIKIKGKLIRWLTSHINKLDKEFVIFFKNNQF